jgi:hypothetical protein
MWSKSCLIVTYDDQRRFGKRSLAFCHDARQPWGPLKRRRAERIAVAFQRGMPCQGEHSCEDCAKARLVMNHGADAAAGHHPVILQPYEIDGECPLFYRVGNFSFGSGNTRAENL